MTILLRVIKYTLIIILIFVLVIYLVSIIFEKTHLYPAQVKFGVTFSPRHAKYLKLDWQKVYLNILDELKVKNIRLTNYWDTLETKESQYDFSQTDFLIQEAQKRIVKVIFVLGVRQPRWPECHMPGWVEKLTAKDRQQKTLDFIKQVVTRYKSSPSIAIWQVENEPFAYWFGECDPLDKKFLRWELQLVKSLDNRPIMLTESGEWGDWSNSLNLAEVDMLGISIYKKVYNAQLGSYLDYPFPPAYYYLKGVLTNKLIAQSKKIIVSELQAETWLSGKDPRENTPQVQNQLFSLDDFKKNIGFVRQVGFDEAYLWGVEWWYFMAQNGYPQYLDFAKSLF